MKCDIVNMREMDMKANEIDSSKIKILVCCHKKCDLPQDDIFLPIHVGAALSSEDLGMQRDDQVNGQPCDNISVKNKNYCELTAMYWAWKNIRKLYPDIEYIGLNHYRRFFDFKGKENSVLPTSLILNYKIDKKKLVKLLKRTSVVMHKKITSLYSVKTQYCFNHLVSDYNTLESIIMREYKNYLYSFLNVFEFNYKLSCYNMFFMPITFFEEYCEWLFSILKKVEDNIDLEARDDYQKRVFGFLAERLQSIYVYKNSKKIKYLPVVFFDDKTTNMKISLYHKFLNYVIFTLYLLRVTNFRTRIGIFLRKIGIKER